MYLPYCSTGGHAATVPNVAAGRAGNQQANTQRRVALFFRGCVRGRRQRLGQKQVFVSGNAARVEGPLIGPYPSTKDYTCTQNHGADGRRREPWATPRVDRTTMPGQHHAPHAAQPQVAVGLVAWSIIPKGAVARGGGGAKKEKPTGVFPASEPLCIAQGGAANVPKFPRRHRSTTTASPPSLPARSFSLFSGRPPLCAHGSIHNVPHPPFTGHHVFGTTLLPTTPRLPIPQAHGAALLSTPALAIGVGC